MNEFSNLAILRGNTVEIRFINEANKPESLTLDKRVYDEVKSIMTDGYILEDMTIRPSAITRYLKGTSAAAIHTYNNIEKDKMRRSLNESTIKWMQYGIFVFMALLGLAVLYMVMGGGDSGGVTGALSNTAGTLTPGIK